MDLVDIVASGYEFYCPDCGEFNTIVEIPKSDIVICSKCKTTFGIATIEEARE